MKKISIKLCISIFLSVCVSLAQWPTSIEDELIIGDGLNTEMVSDGNGGALVCMMASNASWTETNIYVQHVNKNGYEKWEDPLPIYGALQEAVSPNTNYSQENNVVSDNRGGMYILFHDQYSYELFSDYNHLRVHHVDSCGNFLWGECGKLIATPYDTTNKCYIPYGTIISDGGDGIIVAWEKDKRKESYSKIAVQRFDYDGNEMWLEGGVIITDSSSLHYPQMGIDVNNGIYIYAKPLLCRIDETGTIDWKDTLRFSNDTDIEKIYNDLHGGVFILGSYFPDINNGIIYPDKYLFCQRLDSEGQFIWNNPTYIDTADWGSVYYNACLNQDASLLVVKQFSNTCGTLCRIDYNGKFLYENIVVDSLISGYDLGIYCVNSVEDNSNIVAFHKYPENYGIYGMFDDEEAKYKLMLCRFDMNGNIVWEHQPVIVGEKGYNSTIYMNYSGTSQIVNPDNSIIVCSTVQAYSYNNVVINRITKNGVLGGPVSIDENTIDCPNKFQLYQNYPNPFNMTTIIAYQLVHSSNVQLQIYDLLGKCIFSEQYNKQSAGYYVLQWSGLDNEGNSVSSGIYYLTLTTEFSKKSIKITLLK